MLIPNLLSLAKKICAIGLILSSSPSPDRPISLAQSEHPGGECRITFEGPFVAFQMHKINSFFPALSGVIPQRMYWIHDITNVLK